MHSNLVIVGSLTVGFALASFFAYIMQRLKLPSIIGYLLAGFIIGPYSPGFIADPEIADQLAEIGVILMLFGVGLHFKIEDLLRVKNIAIPGAVFQTFGATLFATIIIHLMGWTIEAGVIIGLSIGVASTVVLVRILTENNILKTQQGHIAIGWLVVEDIFTIIILILLPTIAAFYAGVSFTFTDIAGLLFLVIAKFCILVFFMFTWGHRIIDYILTKIARLRSQEIFTLTIIALVFVIATGSSIIFGTSIALGAFLAGMVIGKTSVKHQAAANALPLKDIFAVIFFLSVGMLFNPIALSTHFPFFLGTIFVILIIKPAIAYLIIWLLGYPLNTALTVAISLAQIGEFSFILAEEAMNLKMIPEEGFDIIVACALISISLNPILFELIGSFKNFLQKFKLDKISKNQSLDPIKEKMPFSDNVLIIGFGPIGREVSKIAENLGFTPLIIEQNIDTVSNMKEHCNIIFGDASESNILEDAHIKEASHLFITIPDVKKAVIITHAARHSNPNIQIVARVEYLSDKSLLEELKINYICTEVEALNAYTSLTKELLDPS